MKIYAYKPTLDGKEPTGTSNRLLYELKTKRGALKRAYKFLGNTARVYTYTNLYNESTYTKLN